MEIWALVLALAMVIAQSAEEIFYYLYFKNVFKLEDSEIMSNSLEDKRFGEWKHFTTRIN